MGLPERIGRFNLLAKIGSGGMAEVFRAEETLEDGTIRLVAIKRLYPRLAADREFVGMFVNEAQIASNMNHPNIVRTYDLVNTGSHYYIIMEFITGLDLEDLIAYAPPNQSVVPVSEAAYLVHEVATGLGYAHRGGTNPEAGAVVHRDITPGNIMIDSEGRVAITDFGIARAAQYAHFTRPGILKGKYEYMAPEYIAGRDFDGRADLFSLGVVLYELLTGRNPFLDPMPQGIWNKILKHNPPPPSELNPELPQGIDLVIERVLDKNPGRRVPTGEVLAKMLEPFFASPGKAEVVAHLSKKIATSLERRGKPDVSAYEPINKGDPTLTCTDTNELHLDDILQLVQPVAVPRPVFPIALAKNTFSQLVALGLRWKRFWLPAGALLLALVLLLSFSFAICTGDAGKLYVTSDFATQVAVDGEVIGFTPIEGYSLKPGAHTIEGRRPGTNQVQDIKRVLDSGEDVILEFRWETRHSDDDQPHKRQRPPPKQTPPMQTPSKKTPPKKTPSKKTPPKKTPPKRGRS